MLKKFALLSFIALLAACKAPEPPSEPPAAIAPPEVARSGFITAYTEQDLPLNLKQTRKLLIDRPIIEFLEPTPDISVPVSTEILSGTWPNVGAVRRVKLEDGHYVIERITKNEPRLFEYQLYVFTNAAGQGVEQVVGEQKFVEIDNGTRFEWRYQVVPKNAFTSIFVKRQIGEIENYIASGLEGFANEARKIAAR